MLIQQTNQIAREAKLEENNADEKPALWEFKQIRDAMVLGVELIWPYKNTYYSKNTEWPDEVEFKNLSADCFSLIFPARISVQEKCSLLIMPYTLAIKEQLKGKPEDSLPVAMNQCIELDWWPGTLEVIFHKAFCCFLKGQPFAQAIVIPRRDYTLKEMPLEEKLAKEKGEVFINKHAEKYITRRMHIDGYSEQTNLYDRLSQMNKDDELPVEIRPKKTPQPRLRW